MSVIQNTPEQNYDLCIAHTVGYLIGSAEFSNIILSGIDLKDKAHLCVLEIAKIFCPFMQINVAIDGTSMNFLTYIFHKRKIGDIKRTKNFLDATVINMDEFLDEVSDITQLADGAPNRNLLALIYDAYYAPLSNKEKRKIKKANKE